MACGVPAHAQGNQRGDVFLYVTADGAMLMHLESSRVCDWCTLTVPTYITNALYPMFMSYATAVFHALTCNRSARQPQLDFAFMVGPFCLNSVLNSFERSKTYTGHTDSIHSSRMENFEMTTCNPATKPDSWSKM